MSGPVQNSENNEFYAWNVIVSGGTRGIGAAISRAFLNSGAKVTALCRNMTDSARLMQDEYPPEILRIEAFDIADPSACESFFKAYNETHDSLEIMVNNAGIRRDNAVGMMPFEDWQAVLSCNLGSSFIMSKLALLKMMEKRFGRIISISSPSGVFGFQGQANYAASKAGQVALAKSLSKEAARRNITVNCISPGFIETELIADLSEEAKSEYRKMIPLRKFGKPEDVAHAVLFLASRSSSYITGSVLEVTGGL